jgi:hypothetical protein
MVLGDTRPMDPLVKDLLIQRLGPAPSPDNWGGLLGWIEANDPNLYLELWLLDRAGSGILFDDPAHTISWNIATRAAAGDPVAKALCDALNLLSPDHCKNVLSTRRRGGDI